MIPEVGVPVEHIPMNDAQMAWLAVALVLFVILCALAVWDT
jgi:branched-subunit amino acid permease